MGSMWVVRTCAQAPHLRAPCSSDSQRLFVHSVL